jgi:hypothetical protein
MLVELVCLCVPLTLSIHIHPKEPIGKLGEESIAQGDLPPYVIRGECSLATRNQASSLHYIRIHLTQNKW